MCAGGVGRLPCPGAALSGSGIGVPVLVLREVPALPPASLILSLSHPPPGAGTAEHDHRPSTPSIAARARESRSRV